MKDITIKQFKLKIDDIISEVLSDGDIYKISTNRGNVVLMEEAEYNVLRDALDLLIKQK